MVAAIVAGETHLFHELIRPYERSVYVMALSFLKNDADAEDAAQEAFLKAFRNLSTFRGDSKFGTWLISITLNESRSRLRRQKSVKLDSIDAHPDDQAYVSPAVLRDWREIPSDTLERKEVRHMLKAAVEDLPPAYREIFLLRDVEELSIAETAEVLQISPVLVKVRLHRARIMLQKRLVPELKHINPKRRWFSWS
ncbi:MAG: sigma-70 family RNA polymerase sigma factor [Acidobacteriaceae bacterium]